MEDGRTAFFHPPSSILHPRSATGNSIILQPLIYPLLTLCRRLCFSLLLDLAAGSVGLAVLGCQRGADPIAQFTQFLSGAACYGFDLLLAHLRAPAHAPP